MSQNDQQSNSFGLLYHNDQDEFDMDEDDEIDDEDEDLEADSYENNSNNYTTNFENTDNNNYTEVNGDGKRRRVILDYKRDPVNYATFREAQIVLQSERQWQMKRKRETKKAGAKLEYRCKFEGCRMRANIQMNPLDNTAIIWRTVGEHVGHDDTRGRPAGINQVTKDQIDKLFHLKSITTAKRILFALQELMEPFLPKKSSTDPDVSLFLAI